MRSPLGSLFLALACASILGCGGPEGPPPGTRPIGELIAESKGPIEVGPISRRMNPVMTTFGLSLKNVSDARVTMVKWTVLFLGEDGKPLAKDGRAEGGYAEVSAIEPGESIEGIQGAPEGAAKARLVIESVTYEASPPGAAGNPSMAHLKFDKVWKNPRYAAELQGGS